MKKIIIITITAILFVVLDIRTYANTNALSDVFGQYLQKVCKIAEPAKNQTYIVIDIASCPPCLKKYVPALQQLLKSDVKNLSIIVVGSRNTPNPPKWFLDIAETWQNIFYDNVSAYRKINITPNQSGVVVVKDGKIVEKTIMNMENYEQLFRKIATNKT